MDAAPDGASCYNQHTPHVTDRFFEFDILSSPFLLFRFIFAAEIRGSYNNRRTLTPDPTANISHSGSPVILLYELSRSVLLFAGPPSLSRIPPSLAGRISPPPFTYHAHPRAPSGISQGRGGVLSLTLRPSPLIPREVQGGYKGKDVRAKLPLSFAHHHICGFRASKAKQKLKEENVSGW